MPDHSAIYLFKAARRPLYRKENLHLLAAERGSIIEAAYNRMWVAPEYFEEGSIARGTPVYFVFTERPYSLFIPVRQGEVVDVHRDDLMLRIRVLLRSWVGVEDRGLEDFTRLVKQTSRSLAPGNKFVAPKQDGIDLQPYYEEREDEGWCRAVDEILRMSRESEDDPYRSSVFFRPLGLRVGDDMHVARRVPLAPGTAASLSLRFYNPHLEDSSPSHSLRLLAPEDALRVESPGEIPLTGQLEIPLEVHGKDPELTIQIIPSPAHHTSVTERFVSPGGKQVSMGEEETGAPGEAASEEIRRLYDSVRRNARFPEPSDELDLLVDFQRLLPRDSRIAERKGLLMAQVGDKEEAYRILRDLNRETMGDDARFLLFALLLERDSETSPDQHIISLDLTAEGRFDRFLAELEQLDPRSLGRILPALVLDLPDEQRRELMARLETRVESPQAIAEIARILCLADQPGWAYDYLSERRRTLHLEDPEILELLFSTAAETGSREADAELAADAARRIGNLIQRGKVEDARGFLRTARQGLRRAQRDRLYHRIADQLTARTQYEQATEVMLELVYAACETGDLEQAFEAAESATAAVTRARGLVARSGTHELSAEVEQAMRHVEAAWADCERLVEWRKSAEEHRAETLQRHLRNQRVLIAGGVRNPEWVEHLETLTGANVDWCESFRDQVDNVDAFAARIRQGSYAAVVSYIQKTGHDLGVKLKPACEAVDVPFVHTTSAGRRGAVEALCNAFPRVASGS